MKANHKEALELAYMRTTSSNMARAYIELYDENARLQAQLTAEREVADALREALMEVVRISDRKHHAWDKAREAIAKYNDHRELNNET